MTRDEYKEKIAAARKRLDSIDVGDRVEFRAATAWSDRKVTRTVQKVLAGKSATDACCEVRFGGWPNFRVRRCEITAVNGDSVE